MHKEFRLTQDAVKRHVMSFIGQLPTDREHPLRVIIDEDNRTPAQNRKLWAVLSDIAKQVQWCSEWLTAEEWKHLITANLHGQKCLKGLSGGLVFMGGSTRRMNKREFADVIICAEAFGAENSVQWSNEALEAIKLAHQYREQLEKVNGEKRC